MRYFTDGNRYVRVHAGADFFSAKAESWQVRSKCWLERPGLASKILFTGDWAPCSAEDLPSHIEG